MQKIYIVALLVLTGSAEKISGSFLSRGLGGDIRTMEARSAERFPTNAAERPAVLQLRARQLGNINEARRQIKDLRTDIQNLKPRAARKAVSGIDRELKSIDDDFAELALMLEKNTDVSEFLIGDVSARFMNALTALVNAEKVENPTFSQKIRTLWNNVRLSLRTQPSKNVPAKMIISEPTDFRVLQRGTSQPRLRAFSEPTPPVVARPSSVTRRPPVRALPAAPPVRSLAQLNKDADNLSDAILQARSEGDTELVQAGLAYQKLLQKLRVQEGNLLRAKAGYPPMSSEGIALFEKTVQRNRNDVASARSKYTSVLFQRRIAAQPALPVLVPAPVSEDLPVRPIEPLPPLSPPGVFAEYSNKLLPASPMRRIEKPAPQILPFPAPALKKRKPLPLPPPPKTPPPPVPPT